jgi:hypothetical protein
MTDHKSQMVEIDGAFIRHEAAEAVRNFFRPVVATYNFVLRTSDPGPRPVTPNLKSDRVGEEPSSLSSSPD